MSVGRISEFDVQSGSWRSYCDRLESYFLVNDVKEERKLSTLIAVVGDAAYELMVNLCSPKKPAEMTYNLVVEVMEKYLQPKPSPLAERFRFRQCRQSNGQTVVQYVAELKKMARFCDFAATLDENMRDQFVCGLISDGIRQRLFAETKIDFHKAVSLALSLEAAERDATAVDAGSGANSGGPGTKESHVHIIHSAGCKACGDFRHMQSQCKFKDYVCSRCGIMGHLRRMCPSGGSQISRPVAGRGGHSRGSVSGYSAGYSRRGARAASMGGYGPPMAAAAGGSGSRGSGASRGRGRGRGGNSRMHWVSEEGREYQEYQGEEYSTDGEEEGEEPIYQMNLEKYKPA